MTKVKFFYNKDRNEIGIRMRGHCGTAPAGHDLVCAGLSTLYYTALCCMKALEKVGYIELEYRERSGYSLLLVRPKEEYFHDVMHTLCVISVGVNLLAENYPQHLQLISFDISPDGECQ